MKVFGILGGDIVMGVHGEESGSGSSPVGILCWLWAKQKPVLPSSPPVCFLSGYPWSSCRSHSACPGGWYWRQNYSPVKASSTLEGSRESLGPCFQRLSVLWEALNWVPPPCGGGHLIQSLQDLCVSPKRQCPCLWLLWSSCSLWQNGFPATSCMCCGWDSIFQAFQSVPFWLLWWPSAACTGLSYTPLFYFMSPLNQGFWLGNIPTVLRGAYINMHQLM